MKASKRETQPVVSIKYLYHGLCTFLAPTPKRPSNTFHFQPPWSFRTPNPHFITNKKDHLAEEAARKRRTALAACSPSPPRACPCLIPPSSETFSLRTPRTLLLPRRTRQPTATARAGCSYAGCAPRLMYFILSPYIFPFPPFSSPGKREAGPRRGVHF